MENTNSLPGNDDLAPIGWPRLAVELVIFTVDAAQLQVLLIERQRDPYCGMWALPGQPLQIGESLIEAALRTLQGIAKAPHIYLEQLYTFGEPDRDPRAHVVSVIYFVLASADKLALKQGAATETVRWHPMEALPDLAFDHRRILDYALQRLRYKLEYTAAAFQLLPQEFTLSELQEVYAIILNDPALDKRNFRKKLLKNAVVIPTPHYRQTGGRPARLYRFSAEQPFETKSPRLFP